MINYAKKGVVVAATVLTLSGCGESSSSSTGSDFQSSDSGQTTTPAVTEFDEAQLVANLVDNVITPTFVLFNQQAQTQTQAVANYCQAEIQSVQESSEEAIALCSSTTSLARYHGGLATSRNDANGAAS